MMFFLISWFIGLYILYTLCFPAGVFFHSFSPLWWILTFLGYSWSAFCLSCSFPFNIWSRVPFLAHFFLFYSSISYLSMVDLQCCTNFCYTGKWLNSAHTDIRFWFTPDYCQLWIGMFHSGLVSCWKLVCRMICRSPSLGSITSRPFLTNTLPGSDRQFDQLASRSHTYMWDFWETS